MGEVWRARDVRLGREVALKILPARLADSPARLARLEREARLLAALNHPRIATLYGFEESGGTPALVMELVEGATLAARLERGPLAEALELARQIAEALEAAHEKGILHRDLKPSNVRLTVKGQVKLLDFGLAHALEPAGGGAGTAATVDADDGRLAGLIVRRGGGDGSLHVAGAGAVRQYTGVAEILAEEGNACVWGGMPWRHSTGTNLGRRVGKDTATHLLKPLDD